MTRNLLVVLVLAIVALFAGCAGDTAAPPANLTEADINLVVHGDFEALSVGSSLDFGWGGSNVTIANGEGEGNYAVLSAETGEAFIFRTNPFDFSGTSGKFSARVKLENAEDAAKVRLIVEKKNNQDKLIEDAVFSENPEATTEWQTLSVDVSKTSSHIFNSVFQVKVDTGANGDVYVDDIQFTVDDPVTVNYLGSSDFINGDLAAVPVNNDESKKWKLPGGESEFPVFEEGVPLAAGQTLESANEWFAGGADKENYPLSAADFPNIYNGVFSVNVTGEGTITLRVEVKRPSSRYSENDVTSLDISSKEYTVDGTGIFSLDIPKQGEEHNETVVHVTCNSGAVTVNSASLNLKGN